MSAHTPERWAEDVPSDQFITQFIAHIATWNPDDTNAALNAIRARVERDQDERLAVSYKCMVTDIPLFLIMNHISDPGHRALPKNMRNHWEYVHALQEGANTLDLDQACDTTTRETMLQRYFLDQWPGLPLPQSVRSIRTMRRRRRKAKQRIDMLNRMLEITQCSTGDSVERRTIRPW